MKKILFCIIAIACLVSCSDNGFKVKGKVSGAAGETLFFEHLTLTRNISLDSVKLNKKGKFTFKAERPAYPDLYRLRLGKDNLIIAVDSTETIEIDAKKDNFGVNFTVNNSASTENIRKLRESSREFSEKMVELDSVDFQKELERHQRLAAEIIIADTKSPAAYYAVHQTINGYYFISPMIKEQLALWAAVATAYDLYYPEYDRTEEIRNITLDAMRNRRAAQMLTKETIINTGEVGFIDISLPNRTGEMTSLSSLKRKVVLIDFSAYALESARAHTLFLRELYEKYHESGFEIYQISLDENKLLWLEQSRLTPWVCVRDENAPQCKYIMTYNVTNLPTLFLMNRNGDIVGRFSHENIEKAITENL